MADAKKWRVVLKDGYSEVEVEAQYARESEGGLRFFNELGTGSQETVASFAKGDWSRYYLPAKVKKVDAEPPAIG